jgi:DNA-binding beta-propeller fold protein YncE
MKRFSLSAGALATAVFAAAIIAGTAFGISSATAGGQLTWLECIGASGCAQTANAIDQPTGLVLSHDSGNVFVTSTASNSLDILTRDARKGTLTQRPGALGCVSETGAGPCFDGRALDGPVAVAEAGGMLYVVSPTDNAVAIIAKESDSKEWRQASTSAGCVSEDGTDGTGGPCVDAYALTGASSVEININGSKLWVGGTNHIALFERNKNTGLLVEKGCISTTGSEGPGCTPAYVPGTVTDMWPSSDGKNLYAVTSGGALLELSVFRGVLNEIGCVEQDTSNGCTAAPALVGPTGLQLDQGGQNVFVAANGSDSLVSFTRSKSKATLGQLTPAACYGAGTGCTAASGLADPQRVRVCENRQCVLVSAGDGVAAFNRNLKTGALTQPGAPFVPCFNLTGTGGCTQANGLGGATGIDSVGGGIKQAYVAGSTTDSVSEFHLR